MSYNAAANHEVYGADATADSLLGGKLPNSSGAAGAAVRALWQFWFVQFLQNSKEIPSVRLSPYVTGSEQHRAAFLGIRYLLH